MQDTYINKTILLLCNNIPLTKLIQKTVKRIPHINLIVRNDYHDAKYILNNRYLDLIIQCPLNNNLLREHSQHFQIPTITLTKQKDTEILKEHFQNGTDYILPVPFKPTFLVLIIKKFCGLIPKDFQQEIRYHKLILLPKQNILKYKEIKIELTKNEKHLLELILETDTPISSNDIYKYICSKQKINRKQVYTIISRLNRKFKTYTGLILLKNKYGVGYYITI